MTVPLVHAVMYRDYQIGTICNSGAWGRPMLFTMVTEKVTCPGCRAKLDGGPVPMPDPAEIEITHAIIDRLLEQAQADQKTPYWGSGPHIATISHVEAWLSSLRDSLDAPADEARAEASRPPRPPCPNHAPHDPHLLYRNPDQECPGVPAPASPVDAEAPSEVETRSLNLIVQDALLHRLKWASMHWKTEKVANEAWPHLADAIADHVLAAGYLSPPQVRARERAAWDLGWCSGASNVFAMKQEPALTQANPFSGERMSTDAATLLGEHADWGYVAPRVVGCTCGGVKPTAAEAESNGVWHRAHLAAVIDANTAQVVREAAEKAWDECAKNHAALGSIQYAIDLNPYRADKEADHVE